MDSPKLRQESFDFLMDYLSTASPSGNEVKGQIKWRDYIKPYVDTTFSDTYGTMVGVINPDAKYKVVIEAHADEIGWNVAYIGDDGYITVNSNGGSDPTCALSKQVIIHTETGEEVKGVFGQTAIHMRKRGEDKAPEVHELVLDVGATTKQQVLDLGVDVGCKITYPDLPFIMNHDNLVGRALDNRVGGFMIAEVARCLADGSHELHPEVGFYFVNAVQEEVGLRGAEMIVQTIKPNVAIVTDVCHDTSTPGIDKKKNGDTRIGGGPVVAYAPSIQNTLRQSIVNMAAKHGIGIQKIVSSYSSGTDTDAFAYANGGTPTALIKIPLKYMHTTVETARLGDIKEAIELIYKSVRDMSPDDDYSYFK